MKTILTALNAKYVHSSLALRYLKTANPSYDIEILEFTINDRLLSVYEKLLQAKADYYCFSCYLWNIEQTLKIAQLLKTAMPQCKIVLGGPEVSYTAQHLLRLHPYINHIIQGEGEAALGTLLSGQAVEGMQPPTDLSTLPLPYTPEDLKALQGKIIYFETSRGCPYQCTYCLSSRETSIRYFPMEYVKKGFDLFFANNVPLVKLVDRTFNADNRRAMEIIRYIIEHSKNTSVHFEIEPHLLNSELIDLLSTAPKGLFQLEIGIQTINPATLKAIHRNNDLDKIRRNILALQKAGNMHIHLDLIAGLPYEDYKSFRESFNYVYSLKPDMLQLGFLKVLNGTPMEQQPGIRYAKFPPYQVVATDWLSAEELCRLSQVEESVERFYNSGAFPRTLEKLIQHDAFSIFEKLAFLIPKEGMGRLELYTLLYHTYGEEIVKELTWDFLQYNQNQPIPDFARRVQPEGFKKRCYALLRDSVFLAKYQISPDLKQIRFEPVLGRVLLVDYTHGELYDVTEAFQ